jgi:zinc transporter
MADQQPARVDTADPCFVWGRVLDGRGGAEDLAAAQDAVGPRWFHVDYSTGTAERWLMSQGVEHIVVESLVRQDTRPRAAVMETGALLVLRGVNMNPGADPEDMVSIRLWIEADRLITVRQRPLLSAQDVCAALDEGRGARSIAHIVTALIESLADRIASFVDAIEERVTEYETSVESGGTRRIRTEVSAARRQIAVVRRYLAPQRDALDALYRQSKGVLDDEHAFAVREQSDRITRYVEDLDLARERTLVIQEELLNRVAQEQNARTYVLSIVAAIFLPISFITGLFGMNVGGLPGVERAEAFWIVAGAMAAISVGIIAWLRLRRWF